MSTLIVGGGLSGLALAERLEVAGAEYQLVEARGRFGGRIKTEYSGAGAFDMGPAWFWPGQPRIAALIARLGLEHFEQYADGILTFEDEQAQVSRGRGFASMAGSWRLRGGLAALTDALAARLPEGRKRLNAPVSELKKTATGVVATVSDGTVLEAEHVVLCLPPRLAAGIGFDPVLPAPAVARLKAVSTWMAGQAKAVAVYDTPFWRDAGLSGDAMSRRGPMVEIHDASPAEGGPYALFGFIGVPPGHRQDESQLRVLVQAQLGRLFGPEAADPQTLWIKDWAFDPFTATEADQAPVYAHPTYGLPDDLKGLWDGRLLFGGTEVAPQFGGYVEGALEAAENVLSGLHSKIASHANAR